MHEAQFHSETAFLTLTYSPENLPKDGSLNVRDLQLFFKRLRADLGYRGDARVKRLRYLAVGEYGEQLSRPHYHVALFGYAFLDDRRQRGVSRKNGAPRFHSDELERHWRLGRCEIGTLTLQSAAYVGRYAVKKVYGDAAEAHYAGKKPEFLVVSKGIGRDWFYRFEQDLRDDFVVMDGQKFPVPTYYDKLRDPEYLAGVKARRKADALKDWRNNTPERLAVREEVKNARIKSLTRSEV